MKTNMDRLLLFHQNYNINYHTSGEYGMSILVDWYKSILIDISLIPTKSLIEFKLCVDHLYNYYYGILIEDSKTYHSVKMFLKTYDKRYKRS